MFAKACNHSLEIMLCKKHWNPYISSTYSTHYGHFGERNQCRTWM